MQIKTYSNNGLDIEKVIKIDDVSNPGKHTNFTELMLPKDKLNTVSIINSFNKKPNADVLSDEGWIVVGVAVPLDELKKALDQLSL